MFQYLGGVSVLKLRLKGVKMYNPVIVQNWEFHLDVF